MVTLSKPDWTTVVPTVVALACPAVLFVAAGPFAAAAGGAGVLVWLAAPVFGFAVGQFGLLAAQPSLAVGPRLALVQGALFVLLVAGIIRDAPSLSELGAFCVFAVVLAGGVFAGLGVAVESLPLAATLVVTVALLVYLLHRYELLVLGLVDERATGDE